MFQIISILTSLCFFFFNDTATTEIYTLSLHDALPISLGPGGSPTVRARSSLRDLDLQHRRGGDSGSVAARSEEHTSELQSQSNLVCRLLLEKKHQRLDGPRRPDHQGQEHVRSYRTGLL